jgi:hypothetical protein
MPTSDGGNDGPPTASGPTGYTGSQFGRDLGFGLMNMPFSPVANMVGHAITGVELEAIDNTFDNLPTTTGGGASSAGTGVSPTGDDTTGTPF